MSFRLRSHICAVRKAYKLSSIGAVSPIAVDYKHRRSLSLDKIDIIRILTEAEEMVNPLKFAVWVPLSFLVPSSIKNAPCLKTCEIDDCVRCVYSQAIIVHPRPALMRTTASVGSSSLMWNRLLLLFSASRDSELASDTIERLSKVSTLSCGSTSDMRGTSSKPYFWSVLPPGGGSDCAGNMRVVERTTGVGGRLSIHHVAIYEEFGPLTHGDASKALVLGGRHDWTFEIMSHPMGISTLR